MLTYNIDCCLKENIHLGREYKMYMMGKRRQNVSKQKNRGEVNFSNKKPWKQKGTGKARAGKRSSPIWIKGGRAFPNGNENYVNKINRKCVRRYKVERMIKIMKSCKMFVSDIYRERGKQVFDEEVLQKKKDRRRESEGERIPEMFIKKETLERIANDTFLKRIERRGDI